MPVTDDQVEAAAKALAAAFNTAANKGDDDYEDFTPRQLARIALEAAEQDAWQPIATAPIREYDPVLVYRPSTPIGSDDCMTAAYWGIFGSDQEQWVAIAGMPLNNLSHWRPLPKPPGNT